MGHDVSGYLKADAEHDNEVAYLRRAAWDGLARTIYAALQSPEMDCGCSGCGHEKQFSHAEIEAALARVPEGKDTEREREFLRKCLAAGAGGVRIAFY
jgi:hypothetical protein